MKPKIKEAALILAIFLLWPLSAMSSEQNDSLTTTVNEDTPELIAKLLDLSSSPVGKYATYTTDADFDTGILVNINHDVPAHDQLQLNSESKPFNFIWVAASGRGTIIKIDTETGEILGEYKSAPDNRARNPSRTTVDNNGNVWAGNRDEYEGGKGSAVQIGLEENLQCQDRNGNHIIETSTGLGDIKPWPNTGGVDNNGGVSTAEDECICKYLRTSGTGVRTIAVDKNNDVWIGGLGNRVHELYDGDTGDAIPGTLFTPTCGGYGGLIDDNGILWSASAAGCLLRYDPLSKSATYLPGAFSYGLAKDSQGNIWNSQWTYNYIYKFGAAGNVLGSYPTHGSGSRGVAITPDDDVWVANSYSDTVTRLGNNGAFKVAIPVGSTPTGVAVDSNGKVWVTNYGSDNVMRIDPATNMVDLTVNLGAGAQPYDYSDMTGSTLIAPPNVGTWTVIHDGGEADIMWKAITWTSDGEITVTAATSNDGTTFGPSVIVTNGQVLGLEAGRYIKVSVAINRASTGESPILYDLTVSANEPPDCSNAKPSIDTIWPPNHEFVAIDVKGVTDPDGDPITIAIDKIYQDEPVDTNGDGSFVPDGKGIGTSTAEVRAERSGTPKVPGNGRVYHISFTAKDEFGGACNGEILVNVPHDQKKPAVDDGALYDSTSSI